MSPQIAQISTNSTIIIENKLVEIRVIGGKKNRNRYSLKNLQLLFMTNNSCKNREIRTDNLLPELNIKRYNNQKRNYD